MPTYAFRILNVFAESKLDGNPLCVFEDARGLDDATMQALALQFNLSETTFILPSGAADAHVRIFTPGFEMPFAGHPTLGTAHVVRDLRNTGDALTLEFKAGIVPVIAKGDQGGQENKAEVAPVIAHGNQGHREDTADVWTFTAPHHGEPRTRPAGLPDADVAALLGLDAADLLAPPMWVDTGSEQLLVPLRSTDAVRRAQPNGGALDRWPQSSAGRKLAYVFAFDQEHPGRVLSRFFFTKPGGGMAEDPGTGSACANLGGWLLATRHALPAAFEVDQGEAVGRPCRLRLAVTEAGEIRVGGRVIELGRGTINL